MLVGKGQRHDKGREMNSERQRYKPVKSSYTDEFHHLVRAEQTRLYSILDQAGLFREHVPDTAGELGVM